MTTVSPGPRPSSVGSQATSSLDPIVGSTPNPGDAPHTRVTHDEIAARKEGVPAVCGYPGASEAAARAARTIGGTGSTGVPIDRATSPSGCPAARAFAGSSWSQGKSGRSKERISDPPHDADRKSVV